VQSRGAACDLHRRSVRPLTGLRRHHPHKQSDASARTVADLGARFAPAPWKDACKGQTLAGAGRRAGRPITMLSSAVRAMWTARRARLSQAAEARQRALAGIYRGQIACWPTCRSSPRRSPASRASRCQVRNPARPVMDRDPAGGSTPVRKARRRCRRAVYAD